MRRSKDMVKNAVTAATVVGLLAASAVAVAVPPSGAVTPKTLADGGGAATEDKLKAAFVYNFIRLTEWPEEAFAGPASPLVVCVIGRGTLADALEATVSGKNVAGRPIIVHRCDAAADIGPCHVLLVAAQDRARDALAAVNGKPVLAVGDGDAFLPAGGTIRFFTENNKMRFEVSQSAAARAKLKISSKLLGLARLYSDGK